MDDRILRELTEISPMFQKMQVSTSDDFVLDSWKGAAIFSMGDGFKSKIFSKENYEEFGMDYFIENCSHFASNLLR